MERNYDDRQKSQQDRNRQPEQANQNQRGGAQGSAADLDKRGRAGLPETEADRQRSDRHRSEF